MSELTLVIGSKRTSSWSLRPWLMMREADIPFDERVIELRRPETRERILEWSPSGRVPVLVAHGVKIWDSLAIAEFLAEMQPSLWPDDAEARAVARSISAEMHSGFAELRAMMPMDVTSRFGPPGRLTRGTARDIQRIIEIWRECRARFGGDGPFLFGQFSIADAMYAPVCSRFTTYAVPLDDVSQRYVTTIMERPAMRAWVDASDREGGEAPAARPPEAPARRLEPAEPPMPHRGDPPPRPIQPPVQHVEPPPTAVADMPPPPMPSRELISTPASAPLAPAATVPPPIPAPWVPAPTRQPLVVNVAPATPPPPAPPPTEAPPAERPMPPPVRVEEPVIAPPSRGLPEFRFRSLFRSQPRAEEDAEPEFPVVRVDERGLGPVAPTIAQGSRTTPPAAQPRREPPAETRPRPEPPPPPPAPREDAAQRHDPPRPRVPFDIGTIKPIGDGIRRRR